MPKPLQTLIGVCRGTYRALRYWLTHMFSFKDLREAFPALLVLSFCVMLIMGSREAGSWAREHYRIPTDTSGTVPPWWFIRQDYLDGLCCGVGLLVALVAYFVVRRWSKVGGRIILLFSLIWLGSSAFQSVVIWLNCSHILEPSLARTNWPTFDAYFHDAWVNLSLWLPFLLVLILYLMFNYIDAINKHREGTKQDAGLIELPSGTAVISP